jgi:kynureninase
MTPTTGDVLERLADRAAELDATDPLAPLRERFVLPEGVVYLDGNSLGAMAATVPGRLAEVVRTEWAERLISSWTVSDWWEAPLRVGDRVGRLVGAAAGQVVVGDSTSVTVFKAVVAALRQAAPRDELVVDAATFPTDAYVAESAARLVGATLVAAPPEQVGDVLGPRTAAVLLNHVDFRTGRLHDMAALTEVVHDAGGLAVWDLSHSVGVVPLALDELGVDVALGATYKFLGGGPGSPAFLYVPHAAQAGFDQPLPGWTGHRDPFAMAATYEPAPGIGRARTGTPEILSLLALDAALDVWDGVAVADVRTKSLALTGFFVDCLDALIDPAYARVVTPRGLDRGSQVSVEVADARSVVASLARAGVVTDHRPPATVRLGFAPMYVRYTDALTAAVELRRVVAG